MGTHTRILFEFVHLRCNYNKYVGPPHCRAEIYAGRVVCCPLLVSHGEYADGTDRQTDRQTNA